MNHQLIRMARFFFFCTGGLLFLHLPAKAQQKQDFPDITQPPQLFRFVLMAGGAQRASHQNAEGEYSVGSSVQPCWEAGIEFQHSIAKDYFYVLGMHLAVTGRSTIFRMPALVSNPAAHYERNPAVKDRQFDVDLGIPLLVEKQWWLPSRKAVYINTGAQLNIAMNREFNEMSVNPEDSNRNIVQVFHQLLFTFNNDRPWLSYKLGGGIKWILKSGNLLGVGFTYNLSFTNYVSGTYEVRLPDKPDTMGNVTANGSYLGVNVSYGLSGKFRRKMRNGQ